jgi:Tat protein translocase TatB subunit
MFNLGFGELLVIAFVFIIVVGPDRLPELLRTLGKTLRSVQKANRDLQSSIGLDKLSREILYPSDLFEKPKWLPKAPLNNQLGTPQANTSETQSPADRADPGNDHDALPTAISKDDAMPQATTPDQVDKNQGGVKS